MKKINTPTTLTLIRLIASPIVLPLLCVYLLPYNNFVINILLSCVFAVFSLTDFFDGYLARKYGQETALGSILDPIADKFLMYSILLSLVVAKKLFFFWAVILIGREFFMMGLRQVALEHHFSIPVSGFAKLKTAVQMVCFTFIILNPYQSESYHLDSKGMWNWLELFLVSITLLMSIYSAAFYYRSFIVQFRKSSKDIQHIKG